MTEAEKFREEGEEGRGVGDVISSNIKRSGLAGGLAGGLCAGWCGLVGGESCLLLVALVALVEWGRGGLSGGSVTETASADQELDQVAGT